MNESPGGNPRDDPVPDLADDLLYRVPARLEPVYPSKVLVLQIHFARTDFAHPRFQPPFQMQTANDPA